MTGRTNPYDWLEEEPPEGIFIGAEPSLSLLGLPQGGPIKRRSMSDDQEVAAQNETVRDRLEQAARALSLTAKDGVARQIDISDLGEADMYLLRDVLAEGEASVMAAGPDGVMQASESAFPGLWLVHHPDCPTPSFLEVADVPGIVRDVLAQMAPRTMPLEHIVPPDGAMNVMGVLAEIRHVARTWRPGDANHVMNFTLLPMTEADTEFLAQMLGHGPVQISSGGYGAARVIATAFNRVWAVQYLNAMGVVILDTIEIGDVPIAAKAAQEDHEDSAHRLSIVLSGALQ